jgi:hypothetical protein
VTGADEPAVEATPEADVPIAESPPASGGAAGAPAGPAAPAAKRARAAKAAAPAKRTPAGTARTTSPRPAAKRQGTPAPAAGRGAAPPIEPATGGGAGPPPEPAAALPTTAPATPPPGPVVADAPVLEDGGRPRRLTAWPDRVVAAAAALAATDVLVAVGVVVTGLVANAKQGPVAPRLGAAFVDAVGTAHGLVLVVAAGLLAWASRAGAGPMATTMAKVVAALAVMFFIAAPLAAWGHVAYLHHSRQAVDGVVRAQLATWMAGTLVPTGVAAMLAWWVATQPA